jgi:hypothetical protein
MIQHPTTPVTFTPSASTDISPPAGNVGWSFTAPLPAVDASNTALTVQNLSGAALLFQVGTGAVIPSGPTVQGCYRLESGRTMLLETEAATATNIGATMGDPGSIRVTRGTVATATVFQTK